MTSPRTRSLLAALLFLGQLSGALHVLGHVGERGCAHAVHDAHAVHEVPAGDAHVHARGAGCEPWSDRRDEPVEPSGHDGALCGLCLASAAGIGTVDTTRASTTLRRDGHALAARRGEPSPSHRVRPHPARGPPTALS